MSADMELPKSPEHDEPARSETIASANTTSDVERPRKASLVKRVKTALKNRENVKLAACYWALATAGASV